MNGQYSQDRRLFWITQMGELLPGIDGNIRDYRHMYLAKLLAEQGHEVVRWSTTFEHFGKKFRCHSPITIKLAPHLTLRLLHAIPAYNKNISFARYRQQRHAAKLFLAEADSWPKPDLIFAGVPVPEWAEACCIYGKKHGVPVVVDVQDLWPDIYLSVFPRIIRPIAAALLSYEFRRSERIFRAASGITAVSETYLHWALQRAGREGGNQDGCFPLGAFPIMATDITATREAEHVFCARYGIPLKAMVVAFVGTFGVSYDLHTIVKAARILHSQGERSVHFVIAGDGQQMVSLRKLSQGLPNVTLLGWVDQSAIKTLCGLASVGLCAYSAHALQSIPYKPIEYMAAGLPLLSSLKGEMRSILEKEQCGVYYAPGDPIMLAESVQWYLNNPTERVTMGQKARDLFERRFDAAVIYPEFVRHLERLIL